MTTYVFDGTQDVTLDNFDVNNDKLVFSVDASDVTLISDAAGGAKVNTNSGATLTFSGLSIGALSALSSHSGRRAAVRHGWQRHSDRRSPMVLPSRPVPASTPSLAMPAMTSCSATRATTPLIGGGGSDKLYSGQGNDTITLGRAATRDRRCGHDGHRLWWFRY